MKKSYYNWDECMKLREIQVDLPPLPPHPSLPLSTPSISPHSFSPLPPITPLSLTLLSLSLTCPSSLGHRDPVSHSSLLSLTCSLPLGSVRILRTARMPTHVQCFCPPSLPKIILRLPHKLGSHSLTHSPTHPLTHPRAHTMHGSSQHGTVPHGTRRA
jgi:hypothetical protein